jgi:hypothetical protein
LRRPAGANATWAARRTLAAAIAALTLTACALVLSPSDADASANWTSTLIPFTTPGPDGGPPDAVLTQVSCTTKVCVGLGTYYDDTDTKNAFVARLTRGSWVTSAFPLTYTTPVLAEPDVTCAKRFCVIVYGTAAALSDDGGATWTTSTLPDEDQAIDIRSVSCVTKDECVAVGGSVIETLAEGTWTAQNVPMASGASGSLQGVSCTTSTSCVAVGFGEPTPTTGVASLVETESGGTWSPTFLPPTTGASYGSLSAVSCPQTGVCTAVGSWYPSDGGYGSPLVVTLSGGQWFQSSAEGEAPFAGVYSVACMAANACYAVEVAIPSGVSSFVSLSSGAVELPDPSGATAVSASSVSCASTSWCVVAGNAVAPVSGSSTDASFPMMSESGAPAIEFTSEPKATARVGTTFRFGVTTTSVPGDALSETGTLPKGFHFTDDGNGTATISGKATSGQVGIYRLTISASNGMAPAATQSFSLKVKV